jgi:hypothetical protein
MTMLGFVLCFLGSAIFMGIAFWLYNTKEDTAFHKTLVEINALKADVKRFDELISSNIQTVATCNVRVKTLEETVLKMRDELDVFRDQVADTREKQMKLRDALSKKTSRVILPQGPIPIEIQFPTMATTPKSPHQKADPKLMKKIKKELEVLSK